MKKTSHIVLSANVVVLAQYNNPSILNPDFLKINKIVDKNWDVAETITTTPFSQTRFKNGITVTVDNERLNITQEINGDYPESSPIYGIASGYLKILEHIKYRAMGLNWNIFVPTTEPGPWLIDHFLKKSSIPKSSPALEGLNLTMKFNFSGNTINFQLAPETIAFAGKTPIDAIRVRTNTHYDTKSTSEILETLTTWKETQQFIKKQINKLIS